MNANGAKHQRLSGLRTRKGPQLRMPATNTRFRLIPAAPFDSGRVIAAFERVADAIQARDKCSRVEALQRACDEKPELFDEYRRAFRQ